MAAGSDYPPYRQGCYHTPRLGKDGGNRPPFPCPLLLLSPIQAYRLGHYHSKAIYFNSLLDFCWSRPDSRLKAGSNEAAVGIIPEPSSLGHRHIWRVQVVHALLFHTLSGDVVKK